jgi:hypothetical protein
MSTEVQQVNDILGGLSATIADLRAELKATQAERDADRKTTAALRRAVAASNTETWRVERAIAFVESASLHATLAVGLASAYFVRSHIASVALHGSNIPHDESGELTSSLGDESIFSVVTTGGAKTYVALDPDELAAFANWIGAAPGTPKGKVTNERG